MSVSQATVSRLFSSMEPGRVLRLGKARSTRYALRRSVRGLGSAWPLYAVAEDATAQRLGQLYALETGRWYVEQDGRWESLRGPVFPGGLYPGLPWFLHDMRPQGFIGRCFAHAYAAELGAPADPRLWSDDDTLVACLRFGSDLPGAFVVGESMLAAVQERAFGGVEAIDVGARDVEYLRRADQVLGGGWPGSSAAGEQPKFTACVRAANGETRHVIVKFSGVVERPDARRWADLLMAEHAANVVLTEGGIPCAATEVLEAGGRTFLESTRFDRLGACGRRPLVTLEALDAAFFGEVDTPWTAAAERLRGAGWLAAEDANRLAVLWWFGTLIGNTDMHYGNVALFMAPAHPYRLAPTYDMVPMYCRPNAEGTVVQGPFAPRMPPPEAISTWAFAVALAARFWSRLAHASSVSAAFRALAEQNAETVERLRKRFLV